MGFCSRNFCWVKAVVNSLVIRTLASSRVYIKQLHLTFSAALGYGTRVHPTDSSLWEESPLGPSGKLFLAFFWK